MWTQLWFRAGGEAAAGPTPRRRLSLEGTAAASFTDGGLGRLEVECNRCKTGASLPLDAIRRRGQAEGRLGILYALADHTERAPDDCEGSKAADRSGSLDDLRRIMASYRSSWPARRDQLWEMFLRTLASSALWADFTKRRYSAA